MIDFSNLSRPRSAAEREAYEQLRSAQDMATDLKRREQRCPKNLVLKLTCDAEIRHTMSGDRVVHLRGDDDRRRPSSAQWFAPDHFAADTVVALFDQLVEGASVRLDGYWKAREFNWTKRFEFVAQFIAIEGGPRMP
jgi:hypothetical protein